MSIARLLNASADVYREQRTGDGMGGYITARTQVGSVRCRLSQPSATERVQGAQLGATLSHVAYLPPSADVKRGDELRTTGQVFRVLATFQPSKPGTYLRADCELRQAETT